MLVDDAIALLMSWGVSGAPVVDFKTGTMLLGVVSSYDFLQKEAFEGVLLAMEGTSEMVSSYVDAAKKICGQQVGDIMTPNPRTVFPTTTMRVAAELMSNEKLHHLPVVVRICIYYVYVILYMHAFEHTSIHLSNRSRVCVFRTIKERCSGYWPHRMSWWISFMSWGTFQNIKKRMTTSTWIK